MRRSIAHRPATEQAWMRGDNGPNKLHGKIPNAIFTIFRTSASASGSLRPVAGRGVENFNA